MAFIAMLVLGAIAWLRIPLQMLPDGFEPKFLYVAVPYGNGTPVETDLRVVQPITEQLATVPGIKRLQTDASVGEASFEIEFQPSVSMDDAYNDVTDRLERAMPDLPSQVERYFVFKFDPSDAPILWAGIQIPPEVADEHELLTKVVQPRIERVPGVARIDLWGTTQRSVWVDWDRERLQALKVDLGRTVFGLSRDNFQMPGGTIEDGGVIRHVRSLGWLADVESLRAWPIGGGRQLSDIADIRVRRAASASIGRINGLEAASIGVSRESSANTVAASRAVRAAFAELEADPRLHGAKFFTFFDQGQIVEESLGTLLKATLEGGLFSVLILWIFLREWRMTLLIALSIPFSMIATIAILYLRGDSLNILSLMGLMLSVGMLVDNAVVVVETIYQHRARGSSPRQAAIEGTGEVNLAIFSSTLASMVVFLPIILMSDDAEFSFFMGALGFPVVFAHGASLVVALLFAPVATRFVGAAEVKPDPAWLRAISSRYARLLGRVLDHPFDAGVGLVALLALTIAVPMRGVACSGEPAEDTSDFTIRFSVPPQASPADRDAIVSRFERYVAEHEAAWGVEVYRSRLPGDESEGRVTVMLAKDGPMDHADVVEDAREGLPTDVPGVSAHIGWEGQAAEERSIAVTVNGEDMDTLTGLAREVARRAETVEGVLGARFGWAEGGAGEIQLDVDAGLAARYGVDAQTVGETVSFAMRGTQFAPIRTGDRELPVVTRFGLDDRSDLGTLMDFPIWSPALGESIPLRQIATFDVGHGPAAVHREDRATAATVNVDLAEGEDPEKVAERLDSALSGLAMPDGYGWTRESDFGGSAEEDHARNLALVLSIAFVFLIMGMLFESVLLPLAIVTTVPMAMMGAWWALYLSGTPMDLMAGVGLVILVGVVVNNGIVLIDIVGQLRREGLDRSAALVAAGQRRLRPILMTALTTITGLIPMAFGHDTFVGIPYAPLGRCVMGGMIAGTLLTLLYVPWMYALLDDIKDRALQALAVARARVG